MRNYFVVILIITLLLTGGVLSAQESVTIQFNGNAMTVDGSGAVVEGSRVIITSGGTYNLSGSLTDGQVIVDTEGAVRLVLNGVNLHSSISSPLYIANAEETSIILADNTTNTVSDGAAYVFENTDEDEPNAAIFSKDRLTLSGGGTLTVQGNYNDGIASKDSLTLAGGIITVTAADDGIRGKDSLLIQAGTLTVNAGGDGLKADNDEDATQGTIAIESGVLNITSGGDAIQAETTVTITDGTLSLTSGGGSSSVIDESASGIKASTSIQISGGNLSINAADDALNSNGSVTLYGGTLVLASGDDGIHGDATVDINGGDINILESYEGIESAIITINAGTIHLIASDDGVNVAGGSDGSGLMPGPGRGGDGRPGRGGQPGQRGGQENFAAMGAYYLYIHGGYIVVETGGDGIDVNGTIEMSAGTVIVNGPTEVMNGALDYDGSFSMTGGVLVAVGSSGMVQMPGQSSTQNSLMLNLDTPVQAGTLIHIQGSDGSDLLTFSPAKSYQSLVFSSPELLMGMTYDVYYGGTASSAASDGLYQDGGYASGSAYTRFTVSSVTTMIGSGGMR